MERKKIAAGRQTAPEAFAAGKQAAEDAMEAGRQASIIAGINKEQENPASEIIVEELDYIDIVFDASLSHEAGRFVEINDSSGASISLGTWIELDSGYWVLRLTDLGFDKE